MRRACTTTSASGWKGWPPSTPTRPTTTTTGRARTTPTPTSSGRSWAGKSSPPSPRGSWTSAPGSRSSTASSTGTGPSGCWSRSSGSEKVEVGVQPHGESGWSWSVKEEADPMESTLEKDPRILDVLDRLKLTLGADAFDIVDHWSSDLIAVGIASPQNHQGLVYIGV